MKREEKERSEGLFTGKTVVSFAFSAKGYTASKAIDA